MAIIRTKCFLRPDPRQCFYKCWLWGGGARPQPCAGLLGGVFTMDDCCWWRWDHHHHMTPTPTSWTMWSASATPPTHCCPTTRLWRWTTIDASNFCPKTVNQHNHENVCKHHHHQSSSPSSSSISIIIVIKILLQRFSAAPSLSPPGMCRSLSSSSSSS